METVLIGNLIKNKLMCFYKTRQSKVLIAKRDIKVYKIGVYADKNIFNSFFYSYFGYSVNQIVFEKVKFADIINLGFHSYINCELVSYYNRVNLYPDGKANHRETRRKELRKRKDRL